MDSLSLSIPVVIADDHPTTRAGIRLALEESGFEIAAEAADANGAVQAVLRERPKLCLVDVHMPGGGINAARQIAALAPATVVVMLTVSAEDSHLLDALRAGAAGYLLKETDPSRLPHALRDVLAGVPAIPRPLVGRLLEQLRGPRRRRLASPGGEALTDREWEVLELMSEDLDTGEVAERLDISTVTVRRHLSGAMSKLLARDREEALRAFAELRGAPGEEPLPLGEGG